MAVQLPDQPSDPRRCNYCHAHVTRDFRRIYGDDTGTAHRCPECDSWARLQRGSARGKDVEKADPQENPGHAGGKTLRQKAEVVTGGSD